MYEFYMDGVRLPVTPSALTIKISNQNKTINLINEGQVQHPEDTGAVQVSAFRRCCRTGNTRLRATRTAISLHSIT